MKAINPQLLVAIRGFRKASKKYDAEIWAALAKKLAYPKHRRATVNLSHISRILKEGEIAAVPGKVLGAGNLKGRSVAAFCFSEVARKKIENAGGECLSLEALMQKNPRGSGVRIIG
ncbi:50S ribosomal protein L18e [Candidatus Bathyarchaeota archaeon]|nr:50S ribosomal protein L18e [Candidatus Bathyarchaeota archaeon]